MDENTFTSTDQQERELLWNALAEYRNTLTELESIEKVSDMIERVSQTFSWVRNTR